jgi:hypothetical protein
LKEFVELFPTEEVLEIAQDYLAYDPEVKELFLYVQSEEFPKIHAVVEHLKEYKDVSAFMCMLHKHQCDRKNTYSVSNGVCIALF